MLDMVRLALRITEHGFDDEIQLYIDDCIKSMNKLGVVAAVDDTDDSQIMSAVIAYVKWHFGSNDEKDEWKAIYDEKLGELKKQTGYTDWGA